MRDVCDAPHGRPPTAMPGDVDIGFFDTADLTAARYAAVEAALRRRNPEQPSKATNQASVHLWHPVRGRVRPFASARAVATFLETATCVGVRLLEDDDILFVASHGLDDLLNGVCRHNPTRVSARDRQ